ncbi:glycoside hydrolase family 16 protein [Microdochium trichocladiopsis]|uniref:Glycoside hydrolase family 16 protein n=1 Tax=Microdochium trichocladiopsis TaxID=1682393 RepID=A0A9P9BQC6_9PEZI|nr:glycoside hydrolase family 16 protein [Microdochium trichocladiopsis]KAH7030797.1 glycoside hydrolase family 16 protein [Microdochium trichocladiopsis]
MRFQQNLVSLAAAALWASVATAIQPPSVNGLNLVWFDAFRGSAGSPPDLNTWTILDAVHVNNEVQDYTTANSNLQISGGESIQFVPRKDSSGAWTSGRIETKESWTPAPGKVMKLAASLLMGTNPREMKQGIWPAFWALGDAMRHGTEWPLAGEIDIFEQVSGHDQGWGTVHCGHMGGGPCNEPSGLQTSTVLPADGVFNEWAVTIDLTNPDWRAQTLTWQLNGNTFKSLCGADLGDEATWATLAHSPLYLTLNVAVGGNWPGPPNEATLDGYGAMMEVHWVGVYSS